MAYQSLYLSFFLSFFFFFLSKQISIESVTTSDGYRRGYVSFAHSLLYFYRTFTIFTLAAGPQSVYAFQVWLS